MCASEVDRKIVWPSIFSEFLLSMNSGRYPTVEAFGHVIVLVCLHSNPWHSPVFCKTDSKFGQLIENAVNVTLSFLLIC